MSIAATSDYNTLIEFLLEPFLESPQSLRIDTELCTAGQKAWIRVAFDPADKGRVLGRNGRTIQSIRAVVEAAAQNQGQAAHLEIYGERESKSNSKVIDSAQDVPKRRPQGNHPRPNPRRQS